uniref:Uncharacterized protein n=1 Tax=Arundo donax TaxID=35708 RepID=A0A0A9ATJ1_ARUDO
MSESSSSASLMFPSPVVR